MAVDDAPTHADLEQKVARLERELVERERDLAGALERESATGEILRAMAGSLANLQAVLDAVVVQAARLCEADGANVRRVAGAGTVVVAGHGSFAEQVGRNAEPLDRNGAAGLAILERRIVHVPDTAATGEFPVSRAAFQQHGSRALLVVPLVREGTVIGSISIGRREARPFTEQQIRLAAMFADQAAIAIENARLFSELQERNRELGEALEQQTATAEVLKVISRSVFDLEPVLETLVENAAKLCGAQHGFVYRFDGESFHLAAAYNVSRGGREAVLRNRPVPGRGTAVGRAALECRTVHIPDALADPDYDHPVRRAAGFRTILSVPMLREGNLIGAFALQKSRVEPFTTRQIELIESFADQAMIAIENVRLFQELHGRTRELARSVEELKALGEISQAVNSTLDLQRVLEIIVAHAVQLSGADVGSIYEFDDAEQVFAPRANYRASEELIASLRDARIRVGETIVGQAALNRAPIQVPDIHDEPDYPLRQVLDREGLRAVLAVPILREARLIGALVVRRRQPGAFAPGILEGLQAFAAQSALAIQNARLFQELEAKGRELAEASRHKSEFLANMSHELRTPLNAIIGYAELLQEEAEDLGQEDFLPDLEKIHAAGKHLLGLINDILDLSKIEAGKMDLYLEHFDVPALVRDVRAIVQPLVERNGNALAVDCPADVGAMRADLTKVRQALFNLLSNAAKFTDHGTISLTARREATAEGDRLSFEVRDSGVGMTPEQQARLFQAFSQADASTTRKYGGTGLGLAISRHFCQLMGGDIAVESQPGTGSTFTIRLPAEVEGGGGKAEGGGPDTISPDTRHPTPDTPILLAIDDDPTIHDLLRRTLKLEGMRLVAATGGEEGLRLAGELRPAVITLDVLMPGLDGWAVLAALKADPELAEIPVVMLTILAERNLGYALGAADYLTKPIDRDRLAGVLRRQLDRRRDGPVLVVDDDPAARELLRRMLEREGREVVEADNGRAALAQLEAREPAVVLLDLTMPEMDGFEFVAALRQRPEWRAIPVVVVTARDLTVEDHERLNGSVERILQKGAAGPEELLDEVRDLVGRFVRAPAGSAPR